MTVPGIPIRWDRQPYLIERRCTCRSKNGECHRDGYHAVAGHSIQIEAEREAYDLTDEVGVAYRVVRAADGRVLWEGHPTFHRKELIT